MFCLFLHWWLGRESAGLKPLLQQPANEGRLLLEEHGKTWDRCLTLATQRNPQDNQKEECDSYPFIMFVLKAKISMLQLF